MESLRSQVVRLEAALSAAQGEYQRQVARNASELCDFRKQRAQELSEMLVGRGGGERGEERGRGRGSVRF